LPSSLITGEEYRGSGERNLIGPQRGETECVNLNHEHRGMEMERITNDLKVVQNVTPETSEKTRSTSADYRTAVARMIVKTRLACSLPAFETQELAAAVEAWCEILYGVVPVERINDAYLLAMRSRNSTFPIAATEVIEASKKIAAEIDAKRRPACMLCGGRGSALVYDPASDTDIVKECPYCFGKVSTAIEKAS
jgi:hypothetical protein